MQPVFEVLGYEAKGIGRKTQGARRKAGQKKVRYKVRVAGGEVAEDLFRRGLCLLSGTAMTEGDMDRVAETIFNSRKKAQGSQFRKRD